MLDFKISKLQLTNFRNLSSDVITFKPKINCIFGLNGNGKTNLLEAVHFLIHRKSFRKNTSFPQIISIDSDKAEILFLSLFENADEKLSHSGKIDNYSSQWYTNNQPTKKKLDLTALFVNPFDSYGFHTTPSFRRTWIDSHISLLSKDYKRVLKTYNQVLKQRNTLLSEKPHEYKNILNALLPQFVETSYELVQMRHKFLNEINSFSKETFQKIFSEKHELELIYDSKFASFDKKQIENYFLDRFPRDNAAGLSVYGVHRDDYIFKFDGINSFEYCSLGQQKMSFLSLIFAYIELFRYKFNSYPIVLIDDVSGELDSRRWKNLIDYLELKNFQVLITTANENFKEVLESIPSANKIYIDDGSINITS